MKTLTFISLTLFAVALSVARDRPMSPDERRERVETVIIGKFADELALTPEEAEKFYPRLRQFRMDTEPMQRKLAETRHQLDVLSEGEVPKARAESMMRSLSAEKSGPIRDESNKDDVKALIVKSNALQTEILAKREQLLTDLADFLTPQQVSRCSILLDELPRRIRQFMEERRGPPSEEERQHFQQDRHQRRQAR